MTDSIGRADYLLGTDIRGVKTGVAEAEAEILKSGARVEDDTKTRGYRIGQAIGTGIKVVATASTALFAIAAKGAIELQNVQADFTAETGATAAEAERAGKAINAMSGRNMQGIKEIGGALTKVHTDMGLVGDEAERTTERFLKFARATNQDAAGAVVAFDNILDAWGLTAKDAAGIMDKLIVSHQKYGGSIEENQRALASLAPQLKALNLSLDDGIGLLNLFASTGLDASKAQAALNSAVSKLPPGTNLKDFLAHLATVVDDGQRARTAIDVFGARAGAALANAIRPGVAGLDSFTVSADDAAGATIKAADALDSTFSTQVQLKIKEVGAAIRDLGPGITGVASALGLVGSVADALGLDRVLKKAIPGLVNGAREAGAQAGSALADGLQSVWSGAGGTVIGNNISQRIENIFGAGETVVGKAWRKVTGSGPAKAAAGAAGAASGAIYGVAAASAEKLSGLMAGAWQAMPGSGAVRSAVLTAGLAAGGAYGVAFTTALLALPVVVIGAIVKFGFLDVKDQLDAQTKTLSDKTRQFASTATIDGLKKVRADITAQKDALNILGFIPIDAFGARDRIDEQIAILEREIVSRTKDMDSSVANEIARGAAATAAAAAQASARAGADAAGHAIEDGVHNAQGAIARAKAWMAASIADPFIQKAMHRSGLLAMGAVAQGISDGRQKVTDAFDQLTELLKHPMSRMAEISKLWGELTSKELVKGLKSHDPQIRAQAQYTKGLILDRLDELKAQTGPLSKKAMAEVEKGLKSKDPDIRAAARAIKNHVTGQLDIGDQAFGWGQGIGAEFGKGLASHYALEIIRTNAIKAAHVAASFLHGASPPPEGPLHTIDKGGENVGVAWAEGVAAGVLKGSSGIAASLQGLLAAPGLGGTSLKFAPTFGGAAAMVPAAFAGVGSAAAAGGNTYVTHYHEHVAVEGLVKARDSFEIATTLRRFADFRTLTPPKEVLE